MSSNHIDQVTFTKPEQAALLQVKRDATPLAPDEVAGQTQLSLISAGTELAGYHGLWSRQKFPAFPGYAAVFQVEAVGSDVDDIAPGDLVFSMGRHQSYQRFPRKEVLPVPIGLSPEIATFARMMSVTMTTLMTTAARPGELVVVMGLGLVGHLATKNFTRAGYRVIGIDPAESRRQIAHETGIADVRAAPPFDDPAVAQKVALVLECSGHEQAFLDACNIVRKRGEVVQVATPWRRQTDLMAHDIQRAIFFNYPVIRSGWEWELPRHTEDFRPHSIFANLQTALNWLAEGSVQLTGTYTLASPQDAQTAYQQLQNGKAERLAILFDWRT